MANAYITSFPNFCAAQIICDLYMDSNPTESLLKLVRDSRYCRASTLVFTGMVDMKAPCSGSSYFKRNAPREFADLITKIKGGPITEGPIVENFQHPGHMTQIFIWVPDWEVLFDWERNQSLNVVQKVVNKVVEASGLGGNTNSGILQGAPPQNAANLR